MQSSRLLVSSSGYKFFRNISRCSALAKPEKVLPTNSVPENLIIPPPADSDKPTSPKIESLFSQIAALNLIEVSELSSLLKRRLNLPDAPVMPMGGFAAVPASTEDDEDAAPVKVKTSFTVKLIKFDEKQKIALIKEIKGLLEGMNLVQAKKFVESTPAIVKADIAKDEAEKLKEALTKVGAQVEIE